MSAGKILEQEKYDERHALDSSCRGESGRYTGDNVAVFAKRKQAEAGEKDKQTLAVADSQIQ